ncbi:1283_t:CDS:2, partial [Funneliformis caledonium]
QVENMGSLVLCPICVEVLLLVKLSESRTLRTENLEVKHNNNDDYYQEVMDIFKSNEHRLYSDD